MKTIGDNDFQVKDEYNAFTYQEALTTELDKLDGNFDQSVINEIVLWKVNRYAKIKPDTLKMINQIKKNDKELNEDLTKLILTDLLSTDNKGVQLPMASTILRFRKPNVYQILDQRVFRFLFKDKTLKINYSNSKGKLKEQINLYLDYLKELVWRRISHLTNLTGYYSGGPLFNSTLSDT